MEGVPDEVDIRKEQENVRSASDEGEPDVNDSELSFGTSYKNGSSQLFSNQTFPIAVLQTHNTHPSAVDGDNDGSEGSRVDADSVDRQIDDDDITPFFRISTSSIDVDSSMEIDSRSRMDMNLNNNSS